MGLSQTLQTARGIPQTNESSLTVCLSPVIFLIELAISVLSIVAFGV